MEIAHVEFDCIEFEDTTGQYRLIPGYSLTNREELRSRLSQLQKYLDSAPESLRCDRSMTAISISNICAIDT